MRKPSSCCHVYLLDSRARFSALAFGSYVMRPIFRSTAVKTLRTSCATAALTDAREQEAARHILHLNVLRRLAESHDAVKLRHKRAKAAKVARLQLEEKPLFYLSLLARHHGLQMLPRSATRICPCPPA